MVHFWRSNWFEKAKMLKLGIEPKTFALLARRSNQLSYSSTLRESILHRKVNFCQMTNSQNLICLHHVSQMFNAISSLSIEEFWESTKRSCPLRWEFWGIYLSSLMYIDRIKCREEFKKTLKAKPMFWPRFINEWEAYYEDLSKDLRVGCFVLI